ncbi:hypothetical protein GCM10010166_66940 [Couchioplanes caeruleus subsp. azureus]|nr:hypothetical protein GCM10010166_66940 [Couchioplanes caeruleus subsp. azureus]
MSYGDIIRVVPDHERREVVFESFVEGSGHSTIRIILMESRAEALVEQMLMESGCSWEFSDSPNYMAVDIPPSVNYVALRSRLVEMKNDGLVGLQEAAISSIHQQQLPPSSA